MQKKSNLKSFNLYEFLKHQNRETLRVPYFLADQNTYKNAHVTFPFRTFTFGVGITYTGTEDVFKIGSTDYVVKEGCLTTIGPGLVCQWTGTYSAIHDTIYFTEELFAEMQNASFLQDLSFFFPGGRHVIQLSEPQQQKIKAIFKLLNQFKEDTAIIAGLVYSLLKLVEQFHRISQPQTDTLKTTTGEKITRDFRKLVAEHFPEHKEVSFYASTLHITPKYLSEVLVTETGKSAKAFIDEYVSMQAKSLLKQTTMAISEICYWLGYKDTSHFTKAFKKWEKITPSAYRNSSSPA